jgi:hypothetical protein
VGGSDDVVSDAATASRRKSFAVDVFIVIRIMYMQELLRFGSRNGVSERIVIGSQKFPLLFLNFA